MKYRSMKYRFYFFLIVQLLVVSLYTGMGGNLRHITIAKKPDAVVHHMPQRCLQEKQKSSATLIIHTIYGDFEVTEPVLIDLFNSPVMERIKYVRQYGVLDYVIKQKKEYTRYEHCVGVWALLRMHGATLEEQIAGLLHDASHTVFSHVADMLFSNQSQDSSYQDDIHAWYLKKNNTDALLSQHNIPFAAILHKSGTHRMLEQDLPNICADRLEYNLQAGLLTNMLTSGRYCGYSCSNTL